MENIAIATTAPALSAAPSFGMPGYQSTTRSAGVSSCVSATGASWTERVRIAGIAGIAGIAAPAALRGALVATAAVMTDAVKGAFPGPDAWSPPIT